MNDLKIFKLKKSNLTAVSCLTVASAIAASSCPDSTGPAIAESKNEVKNLKTHFHCFSHFANNFTNLT